MLWAQNRAEPRAQAVLKKMAEPGAILHLPARSSTRYCGKCGNKYEVGKQKLNEKSSSLADTNAKQVEMENKSKVPVASSSAKMQTTVSFEAYKARKESNRRTFFKPSKKSKQGKDVNIRIGLFQFDPDQNVLKPQWGKNLPLLVDRNSTYSAINEKALAKRKAHDRHFSKISENENYQLLYPDGSEARFLPGQGKTFFDLQAYNEDLGVPYSRVALYLCSASDIAKYEESCKLEPKVLNKEEKPSDSILVNSDWLDDEFFEDQFLEENNLHGEESQRFNKVSEECARNGECEKKEDVKCPTCHTEYTEEDIEMHADMCAENAHRRTFFDIIKDLPTGVFPEEP